MFVPNILMIIAFVYKSNAKIEIISSPHYGIGTYTKVSK